MTRPNNIMTRRGLLKAFTVMELIVTLLISGLIIAVAAGLLLNFSSLEIEKGNEIDKYNKLLQFHKAIALDMQEAINIKHYDDETVFRLPGNRNISYKLDYGCVIRSFDEAVDTFSIDIKNWYMLKDKGTGLPLVLQILILNEQQETDTFQIVKFYDNQLLFNYSEMNNILVN